MMLMKELDGREYSRLMPPYVHAQLNVYLNGTGVQVEMRMHRFRKTFNGKSLSREHDVVTVPLLPFKTIDECVEAVHQSKPQFSEKKAYAVGTVLLGYASTKRAARILQKHG